MGSSSQTSKEHTTETREPWAPAMPMLGQILSDSKSLYDQGFGSSAYNGDRLAGLGATTNAGLQSMIDSAYGQQGNVNAASGFAGSLLDGSGLGGLMGVQGVDLTRLRGLADRLADPNSGVNRTADAFMSGSRDLTTEGDLRSLLSRALAPSSAEMNLSGVASGQFLDPTTNPYVQKLAQTASQAANQGVAERFANSGRYGSGNFAGATAKAIDDVQTSLYADQYNRERAAQAGAVGAIDAARATGTQLGQGIVGDISNVQSTNNQQRLAGAGLKQAQYGLESGVLGQELGGQQFNSNLELDKQKTALSSRFQAAGLLPMLSQMQSMPGNTLLMAGGIQDAAAQAELDALREGWLEYQNDPFERLSKYAAFPTTIGAMGGQSTKDTTKTTPGPGLFQSILGGLSTGVGLLGKLGVSDERLKDNVREVGKLHDGQPVYAYNLKDGSPTQLGLMAQNSKTQETGAVAPLPGVGGLMGYLGVDYDKATVGAAHKATPAKRKKAA